MQQRVKSRKRAVNLSIDADLIDEAKAAGTDLSALLERALRDELKERRWQAWREDNKEAIGSMNRYVEKHGLLSDRYRAK